MSNESINEDFLANLELIANIIGLAQLDSNSKFFLFGYKPDNKDDRIQRELITLDDLRAFVVEHNGNYRISITCAQFPNTVHERIEDNANKLNNILIDIDFNFSQNSFQLNNEIFDIILNKIILYLIDQGIELYYHFSGNKGFHLVIPVDLELTTENRKNIIDIIKRFYKHLQQSFLANAFCKKNNIKIDILTPFTSLLPIPYSIHPTTNKKVLPGKEFRIGDNYERNEQICTENWNAVQELAKNIPKHNTNFLDSFDITTIKQLENQHEYKNELKSIITPYLLKGQRHNLVYAISGLLRRCGFTKEFVIDLFNSFNNRDIKSEAKDTVSNVYRLKNKLPGYNWITDTITSPTEINNKLSQLLDPIDPQSQTNKSSQTLFVKIANNLMTEFTILTDYNIKKIYVYNKETGIYDTEGDTFLREQIHTMDPTLSKFAKNEIIDKIMLATHFADYPFNKQNIIVVKNGVIDLDKLAKDEEFFFEHDTKYYSTKNIPVTYIPNFIKVNSNIDAFFKFATQNNQDFENYILEMFADTLTNHYHSQIMHYLIGEGQNCKGTVLRLITAFLGLENVSSVGFNQIEEKSFQVHKLHYTMANIIGDTSSTSIKDPGLIKRLVGEDYVEADIKNIKNSVKFLNTSKFFISGQHVPYAYNEDTWGWHRRFIISDWKAIITLEMKEANPNYEKDLQTPEEMSHLLNRVLHSYKRFANHNFTFLFASKDPIKRRDEVLQKANPVKLFIEKFIEEGNNIDRLWKKNLIRYFNAYNEQLLGNRKINNVQFGKALRKELPDHKLIWDANANDRYYPELKFSEQKFLDFSNGRPININSIPITNNNHTDLHITFETIKNNSFYDNIVKTVIQNYNGTGVCYLDVCTELQQLNSTFIRDSLDRLIQTNQIYEPRPNTFKIIN